MIWKSAADKELKERVVARPERVDAHALPRRGQV
jgi:hypothetical protein